MRGKIGRGTKKNSTQVSLSAKPAEGRGALGVAVRFGLFVFTVSLASGFIAGMGVKKAARSRIITSYNEMRTLTGGLLAKSVNPVKLKTVWTEADKPKPSYQQTLTSLRRFIARDPRLANAFVVRLIKGRVTYVVDPGPTGRREDGRQILQAKIGESIDKPSANLLLTLKTGRPSLDQIVLE
jgi:hypothetical protein